MPDMCQDTRTRTCVLWLGIYGSHLSFHLQIPHSPPTPQSQALVPLFFAHFNLCQIVAKMQNALCARRHLNPFRAFHYQLLPNVLILCAFFIFLFFPFVALLTQFCAFVFMCVSVKVCCFYFSLLWHNKNTAKQRGEMAKKRRVKALG